MADVVVSPTVLYTILFGSAGLILFVTLSRLFGSANKENEDKDASSRGRTITSKKSTSGEEDPLMEFKDSPGSTNEDSQGPPPLHPAETEHIPYDNRLKFSEEEMILRSREFYQLMDRRRSVRFFSSKPVPEEVIENIVHTAGTSPSGAHSEPWTFVVVKDGQMKTKIRQVVEQEEYINYDRRMGEKWLQDLQFVGTSHEKPYLDEAPCLIIAFKQPYSVTSSGHRQPHYYYEVSTAIACGFLVTAIHYAGLVTVTTTPMNAGGQIRELLGRPENEKVMLLLPVGYPVDDVTVPGVKRKPLEEILIWK